MKPAPFISTPKQYYAEEDEELLTRNEYKVKYNSDFITLMIGKTKNDIIIRSSYYEIKMNFAMMIHAISIYIYYFFLFHLLLNFHFPKILLIHF